MTAETSFLARRSAIHARWAGGLTVVACVLGLVIPSPPLQQQMVVVGLAVALLGFPHGALDPLIAALRAKRGDSLWLPKFLALYVAAAAAVASLWLLSPFAGLTLFLLTSAVHFGLGDVAEDGTPSWPLRWLRVAVHGSAPILLPAALHPGQVGEVFGWLLGTSGASVTGWLAGAQIPLISAWGALALLAYARPGAPRAAAAELALLTLTFAILPPLLSFAVYFCAWHSARHLLTVDAVLGRNLRARGFIVALAVLAATAILVVAAHVATNDFSSSDLGAVESAARSMFVALAALTPPHMAVTAVLARKAASLRKRDTLLA